MTLHCDECDKTLGDYLYGPGGIEERAYIGPITHRCQSIPNIVCFECMDKKPELQEIELWVK